MYELKSIERPSLELGLYVVENSKNVLVESPECPSTSTKVGFWIVQLMSPVVLLLRDLIFLLESPCYTNQEFEWSI